MFWYNTYDMKPSNQSVVMQTSMTIIIVNALDQVKPATPYPTLIENKKIKLRVVYVAVCSCFMVPEQ